MEEAGMMDLVDQFLSLISAGDTINSIFSPGGPDMSDLITSLVDEIRDVFEQELESEDVRQATSVAQATSDWFSNVYASAQAAGESSADLLDHLNNDTVINAQITNVANWCGTMESWSNTSPTDLAQQTAALALLLHGWLVTFYREKRDMTADPTDKKAAQLTLEKYALQAVQRVLPLFRSVAAGRMSGISPIAGWSDYGGGPADNLFFRDTWMGDPGPPALNIYGQTPGSSLFFASAASGTYPGASAYQAATLAQMTAIRAAYIQLLQYGRDSDAKALIDAINAPSDGIAGHGTNIISAQDIITNAVPKFQKTGRWLAKAARTLQTLRNIAGNHFDYVVAYQGADGGLTTNGDDGARDWQLGMMPGTSATITGTNAPITGAAPGYQMAFHSNQNQLWNAGIAGNGAQPVFLAAGSTPSIVCMPDASIRVFVAMANGNLGEWDLDAHTPVRDFGVALAPGTSPSAVLLGTDVIVAFHGSQGTLCTIQEDGNLSDLAIPLASGTSPSVAVLADGSWIVAFQWLTGFLCIAMQSTNELPNSNGGTVMTPLDVLMAPGSSPAIASSLVDDFMIVYQATDLSIHTIGSAGTAAWGQGMAGSNPAIAALPFQGYQVAYQDSTGALVTAGDGISLTGSLPMLAGVSSPRIAALQIPKPSGG